MKIYYSGAETLNSEQNSPLKSLGGYISKTLVPNGKVESVFSVISNNTLSKKKKETKVVYLKNTSGATASNVLIYAVKDDNSYINIQLAAAKTNQVEMLASSEDTPYDVDFYNVDVKYSTSNMVVNNPLVLGEIVIIEGVEILVGSITPTTFIDSIVESFKRNLIYRAVKTSETTFNLVYRNIGLYTNTPVITTENEGSVIGTVFGGGLDNSQLIDTSLKDGECIALWLQREVDLNKYKGDQEVRWRTMYSDFTTNKYVPTEPLMNDFQFVIEWS